MPRLAIFLALASIVAGCNSSPPLDVAQNVDLKRFQGKWYEIAKLPRATQANCTGTTQYFTLKNDGSAELVNECHLGSLDGTTRGATANAKIPDASAPAKLSVDFGGGFYGDYWILEVGDHYEYAVVGHPTRDYLWILSRTPKMDPATLQAAIDHAAAKKFDTSKLEYTEQPSP